MAVVASSSVVLRQAKTEKGKGVAIEGAHPPSSEGPTDPVASVRGGTVAAREAST